MSDTMFNIFGHHLSKPAHQQILRFNDSENKNVLTGKPGSTVLTPASKSINSPSSKHIDSKKKTFLQNIGSPMQLISSGDYRRGTLQSGPKQFLQIYKDKPLPLKEHITKEDMIKIEYSRKQPIDDDDELSDCDFGMSEKHIDELVMNLPGNLPAFPILQFEMMQPVDSLDLDDVLTDDMFNETLDVSDIDIPNPLE